MYQPAHRKFEVEDPAALLTELCSVVPATLVTHGAAGFRTSILPMLFSPEDGVQGTLRGHLARGNPQWRELEVAAGEGQGQGQGQGKGQGSAQALAIFVGPDAYVSPAWYEEKRLTGRVVPTWNYVAVQAHGTVTLHHDAEWLVPHVGRLVERHEAARPEPWALSDAPAAYVAGQARAIVGIELRITRLEAKAKLSQNRSDADVRGAIEGLAAGSAGERLVAEAMRRARATALGVGAPDHGPLGGVALRGAAPDRDSLGGVALRGARSGVAPDRGGALMDQTSKEAPDQAASSAE